MSKAIIGIESLNIMQKRALDMAQHFDMGELIAEADYHLNFASASQLFNELTLNRITLLETIKKLGTASIPTLAKYLGRNIDAVLADITRLNEYDLVNTTQEGTVFIPWEEIQIHVALAEKIAA